MADYQASGGIRHAIARTADQVYGSLGEDQRDIARRLFLRLVYVADDAPQTRSPVPLDELRDWPGEDGSPGEVLDRFVAERLITVDADTAQITHEALLTAWPLLRTWIDDNREGLRVRRRLSDAARAWDEAGRDPAALLRGGQLALARDWAADPAQPGQPEPAGPGVRRGRDRGGAAPAGRGAEPHPPAAPPRRGAHRAGRRSPSGWPATPSSSGRRRPRRGTTPPRPGTPRSRARSLSRPIRSAGRAPSLAAQLSLAAYRIAPDRRCAGQLARVVRQPGGGPADRLGRGGAGGQPQPRPPGRSRWPPRMARCGCGT